MENRSSPAKSPCVGGAQVREDSGSDTVRTRYNPGLSKNWSGQKRWWGGWDAMNWFWGPLQNHGSIQPHYDTLRVRGEGGGGNMCTPLLQNTHFKGIYTSCIIIGRIVLHNTLGRRCSCIDLRVPFPRPPLLSAIDITDDMYSMRTRHFLLSRVRKVPVQGT